MFPIALYGAARIGKPRSPGARHFYGERRPHKQAKAERRFRPDRRTEVLKERVRDAIGGVTGEEYEARLTQRNAVSRPLRDDTEHSPHDDRPVPETLPRPP